MTKKYEYLEIEQGANIHPGIAISQAVQLLDLAGLMATDLRDVDRMVKVSNRWLSMGIQLADIMEEKDDEDSEEEPEKEKEKKSYGFSAGLDKQIIEKSEEESDGSIDED